MSAWFEFYKDKAFDHTKRLKFSMKYKPFIEALVKEVSYDQTVEWGCGTGLVSIFLSRYRNRLPRILLDIDEDVLNLARMNFHRTLPGEEVLFLKHDIRKPLSGGFGLSHSHGVLEHFGVEETKKIVSNMRESSRVVVCYVPTDRYISPSFGDECLMPPKKWKKLFNPTEMVEFNEGKDLILTWR